MRLTALLIFVSSLAFTIMALPYSHPKHGHHHERSLHGRDYDSTRLTVDHSLVKHRHRHRESRKELQISVEESMARAEE